MVELKHELRNEGRNMVMNEEIWYCKSQATLLYSGCSLTALSSSGFQFLDKHGIDVIITHHWPKGQCVT